ncbi:MAG: ATPase, T2SS/T4P/T4SS family [Bacillota bacterium]|nr:ATPase, T2SS/T4P/T4SS family [Bacillota bacterium]
MSETKDVRSLKIGDVLKEAGYVTDEQMEEALLEQKKGNRKLIGDILVELGYVTETQKLHALGTKLGISLIRLDTYPVKTEAVQKIPKELAQKYNLIAIDISGNDLVLAVNDPLSFFAIEDVRQMVKMPLKICLAENIQITSAIEYYYSEIHARDAARQAGQSMPLMVEGDIMAEPGQEDAPVVKLLNNLLIRGRQTDASDIHIEPFENELSVRIRMDGTMTDYMKLSKNLHQPLVARIKVVSGLDTAEKRIPQDGHFRMKLDGTDLNVRVSLIPTVYGEKAVLRFLSSNARVDYSGTFGMTPGNYEKMMKALKSPHGIIYVTGPTGSGKTTTLYMILEHLAPQMVNISTIEDPVERNIPRVNQIQVNNASGLTFDAGLRSILRQDPDIIMVGETRDAETAAISVRAAITGHLVLSTLHTNDAVSSIIRLADMGVPAYLIASSMVAIVAQRLVRKVCPDCGYSYEPDETERQILGADVKTLRKGKGCQICNHTGYKGRVAVHEILLIDKTIRSMITAGASMDDVFEYATKTQDMRILRQEATELVLQGVTTVEEMLKTAYYEGV